MDYIPLIDVKKLGQAKHKKSNTILAWGWALFTAGCAIALVLKLIERGVL